MVAGHPAAPATPPAVRPRERATRTPALPVFLATAAVSLLVALVVRPWLHPAFDWDQPADAPNHLVRIYVIDAVLQDGQWFPRWLSDLYLGYGYPLLHYYAPGMYYLASGLRRLGMTVYGSFQWSGVLAVAAGVAGAYALAHAVSRGRAAAGLVAAATFALAPYPFITNLYVRAAIPEALALGLLPWLLLAVWGAWRRGGWWVAALAVLVAALLLTHNISSLLSMGMVALWCAYLAVGAGVPPRRGAPRTVVGLLLGLALAAFFWLPALAETGYVQLDLARGGIYDFRTWLFDPLRAAGATAGAGYPHTPVGPADLSPAFDYTALGTAVPEKVSLGQLLLWVGSVATAALSLAGARGAWGAPAGGRAGHPAGQALFWAAAAAVCWLFATTWSVVLWERLPLVPLVQFPWRFYGPLALAAGLSAGLALASTWRRPRLRWVAGALCAGGLALLAYGSLSGRPEPLAAEPAHDVDERSVAALEVNRYGAGTTSGGEFLPRTARWEYEAPGVRRGIRLYDEVYPQAGWQAGLVRVLDGRAAVPTIWSAPGWIAAQVEAETPVTVAFHQLLFPGWRAFVDGQPVPVAPAVYRGAIEASLGFMVVEVPAGAHRVEVRLGYTPVRLLGTAISWAALALAAGYVVARLAEARRGRAAAPSSGDAPGRASNRTHFRGVTGGRRGALAALGLGAAGCAGARAALGARPIARPPAGAARVVADVAGLVAAGAAETRAPNGSGRGPLPPFLEVQYQEVAGEQRRWLYMHPGAEVGLALRVPPNAYFQAGLALDPRSWHESTGDGVRFVVAAESASGRRTLLDRHVNPRADGDARGWNDVWVDLGELAGQDVRLVLRTDAATEPSFDWAGWSNPQVVVWRGARPHPGLPHKW